MINNWERHSLNMDFQNIRVTKGRPSDLDMIYLGINNLLVIGEIKNERGFLKDGQRHILEQLIDNWKYNGCCLFIQHNKYVEHGDRNVDVSQCLIKEYYWKGNWIEPQELTTVQEGISALERYVSKTKETI